MMSPRGTPLVAIEAGYVQRMGNYGLGGVGCSSCNDCINLNPLLFVYDDNKQARIGDLSKGTYLQLVQAAEKCTAGIIHPGQPLDPDEPDLDKWIQRAERFN